LGLVNGQDKWRKGKLRVTPPVCYASDKIEKSFIPPPPEFLLKSGAEKKSEIIVKYSLFPPEAKAAFEYAVNIWEQIVESEIPIHIDARWRTIFDEDGNTNTILGQAGPTDFYANFEFAPRKNRYYPVSIVEKITKKEITGESSPDISATFNKEFKWYFGTDGNTPSLMYDFVTVVLHEIGHGLGFTGFFFVTGNIGSYGNENAGDASSFDALVAKDKNKFLIDTTLFRFPSTNLFNAFTSNLIYTTSPSATYYNSGTQPRLYAPSEWNDGSSIYHLDDATYPNSSENSLMTHAIGKGEAIHDPGPITKGIFADIGWKIMKLHLDKPKDIEQKKPIKFNLAIESDFELDFNSVFVYYSTNSFKSRKDSLRMIYNPESGLFSATLNPTIETGQIDYYVKAGDVMNRRFTSPSEAPAETFTVIIGPDKIPPVIAHTPMEYLVSNRENLPIAANVFDNLGVDTVYVEFMVNNIIQQSFGLTLEPANDVFKGFFNIASNLLNDGDEIKYKIIGIDSSVNKNKSTSPVGDYYSFKVEKIFEPIGDYFNDFNTPNNDFVLNDFSIYKAEKFADKSLHSPHPYPSTEENSTNFNFTAVLKYPIVLRPNATINFDEIVLVEPGELFSKFGDNEFWDYVIVEGSKDYGKNWLPLAPGYDSGANATWKKKYNEVVDFNDVSQAIGAPDLFVAREIKLLANGSFKANDTILIRFRLFSDPHANGWGWAIDNLRIQSPVSVVPAVLSPRNISVFPNPFNDILNVTIQADQNIKELAVEIINLYGQTISSTINYNVSSEINIETDLNHLASGMYFVVVTENGKQVHSQKIIRN
jgi:hypothetical protein